SDILITVLRLVTSERGGHRWTECLDAVCLLRGFTIDDDDRRFRESQALQKFSSEFEERFPKPPADESEAAKIIDLVIDYVGRANLLAASPAYQQGKWFDHVKEGAKIHLATSSNGSEGWEEALDKYEGLHAVPLMTIHKSKGLEYHTVI